MRSSRPAAADEALDLARRVDVDARLRSERAAATAFPTRAAVPDPPGVARVDEAVATARPGRRQRHERGHVGVAADDPVEGDDVGRLDRRRERDEVADLVGRPRSERPRRAASSRAAATNADDTSTSTADDSARVEQLADGPPRRPPRCRARTSPPRRPTERPSSSQRVVFTGPERRSFAQIVAGRRARRTRWRRRRSRDRRPGPPAASQARTSWRMNFT